MKIKVTEKYRPEEGKRLDLFLSIAIPELSRSALKQVIEANEVFVNGELCFKAGYKVKQGDEIIISDDALEAYLVPHTSILPEEFDMEILYEDSDYLFINKPCGVAVHPTRSGEQGTLVNKLLGRYSTRLPGSDMTRPGIVHRLDKETSGVIVVAKTPKALWWLSRQFAERKVNKAYCAIGFNEDARFRYREGESFDFEGYLARSTSNRKQFRLYEGEGMPGYARFSKTRFQIVTIKELTGTGRFILASVYPLTGRTHQIRVHQKSLQFPIVGDHLYLSEKQRTRLATVENNSHIPKRLYLHAQKLSFKNYNNKKYEIMCKVPDTFNKLIK